MEKKSNKFTKFLALFLFLLLSASLLSGCFAADLVEKSISGISKLFDKDGGKGKNADKAEEYVPEKKKDKPAKPDKESSDSSGSDSGVSNETVSDSSGSGAANQTESEDSLEHSTSVRNLAYVNNNYLLDTQQLYVSLDGVDFIGPAFDLCTAVEEYDYYVCDDSFWGYGDHGCVWEIDSYIYVPDDSGRIIEEDINVYLYLDSPAIPNDDGTPTLYTDDSIEFLAEKFDVEPSQIKTMESGGTIWHYANDENEFFAGAESYNEIYAYLEYDCFVDEMETDPLIIESLKWQFEAFLSRLQLSEAREHRSEMGDQALLVKTRNGSLCGPRLLWDDDVIDREQEYDFDDWYCTETSAEGGFPAECDIGLYLDEDWQYISSLIDDEIRAILAEEVFANVLQYDTDNECIISDIRWLEGNGVRWALCSASYPTAADSRAFFNEWEEYGFGITDGGEVITVYWDFWMEDYSALTDEAYQEICSSKLAEFEYWLSLVEYR